MKKIVIKIRKLMVRFRYLLLFLFFSLVVFSQVSPASAFYICLAIFPKVATDTSVISGTSATLTGNITNYSAVQACASQTGGIKQKGIWYWIPNVEGNTTVTLIDSSNSGNISQITNALIPGKYEYRAYVIEANNKTREGRIKSFTFISSVVATPPIVQTLPATQITETSAVMNGNVISTGSSELIPNYFANHGFIVENDPSCPTLNRGYSGFDGPISGKTGNYTLTFVDLTPDTTYYFRAFAKNINSTPNGLADQQGLGECLSFKTLPVASRIAVRIDPTELTLLVGQTEQFYHFADLIVGLDNLDLRDASNVADSWTTSGGGTINATGKYTAKYTAKTKGNYTVTVTSHTDPTKSATAKVKVVQSPTASLQADKYDINLGESSKLTWSSTDALSCEGYNFLTNNAASNSIGVTVSPITTTTYSLVCVGEGGGATANATATVTVNPLVIPPTPPDSTISSRAIRVIVSWDENNQPKSLEFKTFLKSLITP